MSELGADGHVVMEKLTMSLTRVDDVGGGGVTHGAFPALDVGHSRLPKRQLQARLLS